jgi:hypothetical protein
MRDLGLKDDVVDTAALRQQYIPPSEQKPADAEKPGKPAGQQPTVGADPMADAAGKAAQQMDGDTS